MNRTLIVNSTLSIGGGEKLVYELALFAKENNIQPTVLILNNMKLEYYDEILKSIGVNVVRIPLDRISKYRNPIKLAYFYWWRFLLRNPLGIFNSVHIINLHNAQRFYDSIQHSRRFFWHIANAAQYPNRLYDYEPKIFNQPTDSIVYINDYEKEEIREQYGKIKAKEIMLKLFLK